MSKAKLFEILQVSSYEYIDNADDFWQPFKLEEGSLVKFRGIIYRLHKVTADDPTLKFVVLYDPNDGLSTWETAGSSAYKLLKTQALTFFKPERLI